MLEGRIQWEQRLSAEFYQETPEVRGPRGWFQKRE